MKLRELELAGTYLMELECHHDERGFFARTYCAHMMASRGLVCQWEQMNTSFTANCGTIRGLHFQRPPQADTKIVRCISGAVFDVLVDLRAGSSTFGHWTSQELSASNRNMLYIPAGFAHGFQTLQADTELTYLHSLPFSEEHDAGVDYSDPALSIDWPLPVTNISLRDRSLPRLNDLEPMEV